MQPLFSLRLSACAALLALAPTVAAVAQTADPSATPLPTKPVTVLTTPSPAPTADTATQAASTPAKHEKTAEEKAALKAERLKKYDTNKDGKLDEQERAAMRADREKEKQSKEAKSSPKP